ncbi:MAG: hypothetical protein WAM92_07180, partial [Mycobacterium sp.]
MPVIEKAGMDVAARGSDEDGFSGVVTRSADIRVGGDSVLDDVEVTVELGPCSAATDVDEGPGVSDSTADGCVDAAAPVESCPAVGVEPEACDAGFDAEFDVEPAPWPSPEPLSAVAVALPARNTALIPAATNPAPNHRAHRSVTIGKTPLDVRVNTLPPRERQTPPPPGPRHEVVRDAPCAAAGADAGC